MKLQKPCLEQIGVIFFTWKKLRTIFHLVRPKMSKNLDALLFFPKIYLKKNEKLQI